MQLSLKCSIAIHCLIFIKETQDTKKVTSTLLAQSTGCNPVVIRNILSSLKKAGIITVTRGTGGAKLNIDPSKITLYMIYKAIEPNGIHSIIGIHKCSSLECPVAQNIKDVLIPEYKKIENAIKESMKNITLESMIKNFENIIQDK